MLVAVSAIGRLAMNMFIPSMPGLVNEFSTEYATGQLTLTLYLVAVAVVQLVIGPQSDHFGRRPVLLAGLLLFVVGTTLCAAAHSMGALQLGRCAGPSNVCIAYALAIGTATRTLAAILMVLPSLTVGGRRHENVTKVDSSVSDARDHGWGAEILTEAQAGVRTYPIVVAPRELQLIGQTI